MNNEKAAQVLVECWYGESHIGRTLTLAVNYPEGVRHHPQEQVNYHNNDSQMWALADYFHMDSTVSVLTPWEYKASGYIPAIGGFKCIPTQVGSTRKEALLKCIDLCLEEYERC